MFHAGKWSQGREIPGFMRFYSAEVLRLSGANAAKMTEYLLWREQDESHLRRVRYAAVSSPVSN